MCLVITVFIFVAIGSFDFGNGRDLKFQEANEDILSYGYKCAPCPQNCRCIFSGGTKLTLRCSQRDPVPPPSFFQKCSHLKELIYTDSWLKSVPHSLCSLQSLESLNLAQNNISAIPNGTFMCFKHLNTLNMDYNNISNLEAGAFDGLVSVQNLYLKQCGIATIDKDTFTGPDLGNLLNLDLSHNLLTVMDLWPLKMVSMKKHNMVYVNFTLNRIYKFINTVNVKITDLSMADSLVLHFIGNQLKHIANMNFIKLLDVTHWIQLRNLWNMGFDFHYNPFDCDCDMYNFVQRLRPLVPFFQKFGDLNYIQLQCQTPPACKGKIIYKVPNDDFQCSVNRSCPESCGCIYIPGNETIHVSCGSAHLSRLPDQIPQGANIELDVTNNKIAHLKTEDYFTNVSMLDARQGNIHNFSQDFFHNLSNVQELHLDINNIQRIPGEFFKVNFINLTKISLTQNPYICDCYTLLFKRWLVRNRDIVSDPTGIICESGHHKGDPIINIRDEEFMCGPDVLFIYEVFLAVLLFLTLMAVLFYWYRRRIQMQLFSLFKKKFATANTPSTVFSTDLVLINVPKDENQTDELSETLSKALPNLTIRTSDDVMYGQEVYSKLGTFMADTRCIGLLMSINFLENKGEGQLLFRMAYDAWYGEEEREIVVIYLDDEQALFHRTDLGLEMKSFLRVCPVTYHIQDNGLIDYLKNNILVN